MECLCGVKYPACEYQVECEVLQQEIKEIEEYVSDLTAENKKLKEEITMLKFKLYGSDLNELN